MKCIECEGETYIKRLQELDKRTKRTYLCFNCGTQFITIEKPEKLECISYPFDYTKRSVASGGPTTPAAA